MGKHAKPVEPVVVANGNNLEHTHTTAELRETIAGIQVIEDSIAKHPIPPATVTE